MYISAEGLFISVRYIPSPNHDERPETEKIRLLVIHAISLPPEEFGSDDIIALFTNQLDPQRHPYYSDLAGLKVSSHFFIRRDGEIIQFVPCEKRAWHAGVSCWRGQNRCNDFSIGIELEGSDNQPFTEAQYTQLITLTRAIQNTYPIEAIVGHADIAPRRKTDPGPYFNWYGYRQALATPANK